MQYSEAVWIPLTPVGTMGTGLLASDLDSVVRTAETVASALPIDRYPQTITTNDILLEQIGASDAVVDTTFQWVPENSGQLDKMFINLAILANMTVATSGSQIWHDIRVTISRVGGQDMILDKTYPIDLTISAIGHHLEIVADSITDKSIKIRAGNQLDIRIRTTNTKSMTNTTTWGIIPFFPQQIPPAVADPLFWAHSGVMFYITRDRK